MRYGSVRPSVIEVIRPVQQTYCFGSPSDFSLIHKSSAWGPNRARTTGEINIKTGAEEWNAKIRIEVNSYVSDARLSLCQKGTPSDESLLFETTTNCLDTDEYGNLEAELYINVTMYIAQNAIFENLNISTDSLSINFHPGLKYEVSSTTTISIQGDGSVSMPTVIEEQPEMSSREIIIHLSSGSITGTYPLYDLLSISTTSGSISIDLALHNASTSSPEKPATLQIDSSSGSIRAHTPYLSLPPSYNHIPDRKYQTTIKSSSGSVDVGLVHGTYTSLSSSSGSLTAQLYPYGHNTTRSDILTNSNSGRTSIAVHPALVNATDPLRRLYGNYQYRSGSFELSYPPTWEGTLEGEVMSGSVDVKWEGMRVEERKEWVWRKVKGVKGSGDGVVRFRGWSGSAVLRSGTRWVG